MKFNWMLVLLLGLILTGCGGQSGGLAPSHNTVPTAPPLDVSSDSNFKYGESIISANGWEIALDTTDPIEEVTLANGWNVEVKYE